MQKLKELTRKQFKKWLENKDKKTFVGKRAHSNMCPIATYITDAVDLGDRSVYVQSTKIKFSDDFNSQYYHLPKWAKKFVKKVDDGGLQLDHVMSKEALKYLEECK